MRKPVVAASIIVLVLTLIVVGIHYFVQAFLPPNAIDFLFIFMLALVAVIGVLAGFPDIVDRLSGKSSTALDEAQEFRNRYNMLQLVWNTWIEGVLKQSLHNEVLIELGIETKPDAIEHPWDMVMQMPNREPQLVVSETTMLELFDQTSGSLLILGEPGSGKTTMLLELARQAIGHAETDHTQPIPVVFNLSSWTPKQSLANWLASELKSKYYISPKTSQIWVESDELLLLLDGLDEVASENREACVQAINDFHAEQNISLAVCCRKQEYEEFTALLHLRGAVLIQPLTNQQVEEYLQKVGAGLTGVDQLAKHDTELWEFMQTPLILSILVMVFGNATDENLRTLDMTEDYRKHLFNSYISQMFKRRRTDQQFEPELTKGWLSWLAREMVERRQTIFFVEEIQLSWLDNPKRKLIIGLILGLLHGLFFGLILGLFFGLIYGLSGENFYGSIPEPNFGLIIGLILGLIFGLIFGLTEGQMDTQPTEELIWSWSWEENRRRLIIWSFIGLSFGLGLGLRFRLGGEIIFWPHYGLIGGLIIGLIGGLIIGLIGGLIFGLFGGLTGIAIEERSSPGQGIKTSLKNFLVFWLIVGLFGGLIFGLIGGLIVGLNIGLYERLVVGLVVGLFVGLRFGGEFIIKHFYSRWLLYYSGHIPWNLIPFLDYCTERIFLRQVGGGYIFIHRMLMEHFAAMEGES